MKKLFWTIVISSPIFILSFFLFSCTTFKTLQDKNDVNRITKMINKKDKNGLELTTRLPFLFDQEIIFLKGDISTLWENILESDFKIRQPLIVKTITADRNESYKYFSDSMEIRAFFKKYLKKNARLIILKTEVNKKVILLIEPCIFAHKLRGFKGPY